MSVPPEELSGQLEVRQPQTEAAGITAVIKSVEHVFSRTDLGRGWTALYKVNQTDGYDCPSCAWPDPDHGRSAIAEYCENGAKAIADEVMTRHTASPVLFQRYSVADLLQKTDHWLGQQGRLTHPMVLRTAGKSAAPHALHYEPISWDEAFDLIATELKALPSPDEAIFYTSGRTANETAFLYQLLVRMYGTNNLPDCSNMCHESTGVALGETIGLGKASIVYDDFAKAEVIIIMGQNPGTNAPRMLTALEEAKRNGAQIVAVNPLVETGLLAFKHPQKVRDVVLGGQTLTDLYLQIRINTDLALMKAVCKLLLQEETKHLGRVLDRAFIDAHTAGYDAFVQALNGYELDDLIRQTGLAIEQVMTLVEAIRFKKRIIICWAMGLTQHKNAVETIREVINLLLLKGSIGIEGGGVAPIRGHSNVQGDRTMGIYEKPKPQFLDALERVFGFTAPRKPGYDVVAAVKAMHEGRAKVFFGMGGNFALATSDTNYCAEALQKCRLTVHVSTKLNRSHLTHGQTALILPCLGHSDIDRQASGEQFVTMENTTGVVQMSKGVVEPISNLMLSEPAIVAGIGKRLRPNFDWDACVSNYDTIRDLIAETIEGCADYNAKVRHRGGFYLPNGPRKRQFTTPDGKAHFTVNTPIVHTLRPGELLLMTVRSHDQFNTTVYGNDDRYRGIYNERRVLFMHPNDIAEQGLRDRQVVDLHSHYAGTDGVVQQRTAHRFIVVSYDIPRGNVAAYFPETNVLVPIDSIADKSHTPTSKSIVITVTPSL
ncbi:FdhF/YdeP family oxidoreductase [Rudanella paleaurantiibacter]|uniref:FdhF/YdeP family oxidoreductase n=1 Tax=Rudanella paleaurantiibacter TaxID=2614655 RepID=A0A7J5U4L7_9BACT|nr:FdhF/YdeP family oxidoreductase [Rudanella paleaurantiibacter]KAB7732779.1 FdhF/YdeP family oxidoreductase [Rudanella paleaurantiibacter]